MEWKSTSACGQDRAAARRDRRAGPRPADLASAGRSLQCAGQCRALGRDAAARAIADPVGSGDQAGSRPEDGGLPPTSRAVNSAQAISTACCGRRSTSASSRRSTASSRARHDVGSLINADGAARLLFDFRYSKLRAYVNVPQNLTCRHKLGPRPSCRSRNIRVGPFRTVNASAQAVDVASGTPGCSSSSTMPAAS